MLADASEITHVESRGVHFQTCPDQPEVYLLIREGKRELTEAELEDLQDALEELSSAVETSRRGGAGCQLPPASAGRGLLLWVRDKRFPPEAIARHIAEQAGSLEGEPTVRVRVNVRWTTYDRRCRRPDLSSALALRND